MSLTSPCFRMAFNAFWKRSLHVHIYEDLFSKSMISENGIAIATSIFGLALYPFCKGALHIICDMVMSPLLPSLPPCVMAVMDT